MKPVKPPRSKSAKRQAALGVSTKVLRLRIKDKHAKLFLHQSREVNLVWNYSQDLSLKVLQRTGKFMSAFDMAEFTKGAAKEGLSLHSQTVQAVSEEYCTRRKQFKKARLRWRASQGAKRSLGWIPVKAAALAYKNGQVHYQGVALGLWDSYGLSAYTLRSGSFSEDSRGRWYLNVTVDVKKPAASQGVSAVGVDLGLKQCAVASDGQHIEGRFYRKLEAKLVAAQRAKRKHRVRAIHAKIKNQRKDLLHKFSSALVKDHAAIFVGDVSSAKLIKTKMAKSTLDASWYALKTMLEYKSHLAGVVYREVNEAYSTQECSGCAALTGPKGLVGLAVREWSCSNCGAEHQRDVNSARVIKARGLEWLEQEFSKAGDLELADTVLHKGAQTAPGVGHDPLFVGIPLLSATAAAFS